MDQSVTIDGQRVLLNGEPVAQALGDFSVLVVARGLSIHGKMLEMADRGNADAKNWLEYTAAQAPAAKPTPAPADLIIKAREYYPDNEGLLRMYADCRGYSCDQVAEAIDHAKRL